jgi:hypothetical protein
VDDPWASASAPLDAPPPPPPPPRADLAGQVAALERDMAALAEFRDQVTEKLATLGSGSHPRGDDELRAARAHIERLERQLEQALRSPPGDADPALRGQLATAEARYSKLMAEHEKLLGEHSALKLLHTESKRVARPPRADVPATGDPKVDAELQSLASENAKLRDELSLVKREATTRIKSLKASADKAKVEADTAKIQKDNLLKELAARDSGDSLSVAPRELTLEEITASEVFKTMLGNIRRTSREEVTLLHDAVAKLRTVHPEGYALLLDLVARQFGEAGVENPLALLPR